MSSRDRVSLRDRAARTGAWRRGGRTPDARFSLANERTFLANLRTSLALTAAGVALVQLAPDVGPDLLRRGAALLLVLCGLGVAATSAHRWRRAEEALRTGTQLPPARLPAVLAVPVSVAVLLVAVLVVLDAR